MPVNLYPAPFSRVHQGPIIVNPPPMSMGAIVPPTMPIGGPMGSMPPQAMQASLAMGNPTLGPVSMSGAPRPIGSVLTNGVANPYIQHNSLSTAFDQPAYNTSYTNLPVNDPRYVPSMLPNGQSGDYGGGAPPTQANHTLQPGVGGYGMTTNSHYPSLSHSARDVAAARHSMQAQTQSYRQQHGGPQLSPGSSQYCAECQSASRHRHDSGGNGLARSHYGHPHAESHTSSLSPYRHDVDARPQHSQHHQRLHLSPSRASDASTGRSRNPSEMRHPSPLRRHRSPLGHDADHRPDRELSDQLHGLRRRRSVETPLPPLRRRRSDASEVGLLRMASLRIDEEGSRGRRDRSVASSGYEERQHRRTDSARRDVGQAEIFHSPGEAQQRRPRRRSLQSDDPHHGRALHKEDSVRYQHAQMQGSGRYPDFASAQKQQCPSYTDAHAPRPRRSSPQANDHQGYNPHLSTQTHGHAPLARDSSRASRLATRPLLEPIQTSLAPAPAVAPYQHSDIRHPGLDARASPLDPPGEQWPLPERQVSPSRQHRSIYLGHQPAGLNSSSKLRPQWRDGDYSRD